MTLTQHTLGPWQVLRYPGKGFEFQVTAAVDTIASRVNGRANAGLIAAAPDLLEALRQIERVDNVGHAKNIAKAVIAKAVRS